MKPGSRPLGPLPGLLGEGSTPLVYDSLGPVPAYYKLEYLNPTGSFKDRGASLTVYDASRKGYRCVVEDSSGNTALSVAAYSSRAGVEAHIFVPSTVGKGKKELLEALGAKVHVSPTRMEAHWEAVEFARRMGCYHVNHMVNPEFIMGVSTIAWEIPDKLLHGTFIVPASSGTLLLGLHMGLKARGVDPNIVAVVSPCADKLARTGRLIARLGEGCDLLDALVVEDPPLIDDMARAATRGVIVAGDTAVLPALRSLLLRGYIVEPSSATVEAALHYIAGSGLRMPKPYILILTGSGLKYADLLARIARK